MSKFADLHLHTFFSDGTLSPQELVVAAKRCGLDAIAVVDHDTVDAIEPAMKKAGRQGPEVIPGIELTAQEGQDEIHLLGYFIDYQDKVLLARIARLRENRLERIYRMVDKLKSVGIALEPKTIFEVAGKGTISRLHVARALLKEGFTKSLEEAFRKYIGDKCPAYVAGFKISPIEAIELIRESGGVPVLAHPYVIANDELVLKFIKSGLMGLEVYYPEHSQAMVNFYLKLAKEHNLLITGGSDFHGDAKPGINIGAVKVPYELVEKLRQAR